MDTTSVAASTVETNPRAVRALELYRTHGHLIEEVAPDFYLVPSCSGEHFYHVDYATEECDCPDAEFHPELNCKHVLCVGIKRAKRRSRPHGCINGVVYLDGEDGPAAVPCKRCVL